MNIETPRLRLDELQQEDIVLIHELNSFPEVDRYNTSGIPADIAATQKLFDPVFKDQLHKDRFMFVWVIRSSDTEEFIGEIGMQRSSKKYNKAEIQYSLMPDHWGKGYATEAASAIVHFGFEILGLHRIEAGVAIENEASIRLLERIGMTREGIGRKILPIRGEWKDNYSYSILEEDPRPGLE